MGSIYHSFSAQKSSNTHLGTSPVYRYVMAFFFLAMVANSISSFAQTTEYLICTNDTFIYPSAPDSAWYNINFGDGTADSSYHPLKHIFAKNGKYNVAVKKTMNGKPEAMRFTANVGALPKPGFATSPSCYLFHFANLLSDTVAINGGWLWSFGDGTFSQDESPVHLYQNEANYQVSLQYSRKNQCSAGISKNISVSSGFYPGFDYHVNDDKAIFLPLDTSQTSYHWDFGDKDTTDSISPVHSFDKTGKFPVSLTIKSASGCETMYTDTIAVTSAGIQPIIVNSNLFAAYPNPFVNILVIHYELVGSKNVTLKLYDASGRLAVNINEGIQHTGRYDLYMNPAQYGLRAGLYILDAYFDQEYLSQKLVME